ncbi:unnamed protein product [Paramecium primaurelia]|uniref:EGF-like domain-containing protein n=1 Tax=Paramecium primaurelia TaxID=5886 RepID=A0A8S1QRG3_PARPR|nr:unnamed protein product [Paramecium primaurelia]
MNNNQNMIFWLIRTIFISAVIGQKEYSNYYGVFGSDYELCPDLHTYVPGMHPHQCVSYASVCQGVTTVVIKTLTNGTQHICHPRYQPFLIGAITKDSYSVHCGYQFGYSLVMELLYDGLYKYYCGDFRNQGLSLQRCLIVVSQYGQNKCLYCKFPFFDYECKQVQIGFNQQSAGTPSTVQKCNGQCLDCNGQGYCNQCREGFSSKDGYDISCSLDCQGFRSCYLDTQQNVIGNPGCKSGYYGAESKCFYSYIYRCQDAYQGTSGMGCYKCQDGFFLGRYYAQNAYYTYCYQYDWNCHKDRQSVFEKRDTWNDYKYFVYCQLCDPGYIQLEKQSYCYCNFYFINFLEISYFKQGCVLLDTFGVNCIACLPQYALQTNGTCLYYQCALQCSTCLDTDPNFCTTCDSTVNQIADNGICKCLPNSGLQEGNCTLCKEGYCQECELEDFYQCISCKEGSNRILIDKQCPCLSGYFDPENEDQICLPCDISCPNCFGPSNLECTECLEESISNRIKINDSCPCKNGYADYAIKQSKCGKCHPKCQTCFQAADETQNQYCLTCITGQNRVVSDAFNCDCKVNSGDLDGTLEICIICHYTCGICNGTESTNCIQCEQSTFRELTPSEECLCKLSYYDDNTENIECQKCHYSCVTCANSIEKDACVQCPSTRKANSSGSQSECVCIYENTFDDGFSQECQQCHKYCLTCNGLILENWNVQNATILVTNVLITYQKVVLFVLLNLILEYQKVISVNVLMVIMKRLELLKCSYKCELCENQSEKCLSCPLNSLRILDPIKGCFCPGEYYDKENEFACQRCHFKCRSCDGKDQDNCLSCDSVANRELKNNECKCQPHYFEMEVQECTTCSALCYECIKNFENCTSCNSDRYLVESKCICITKLNGGAISTFEYNGMVQCQKCHYSCGTCGGFEVGDCNSCVDTDHRLQVGNTCICKEGYYDAGLPVCQKCNYQCKGCSKLSESCTSCPDNSFRQFVSGFNNCQCIQRYYDDGFNEVCQKCHYQCLRCNEIETKCELCSPQSNRIYNDVLFTCDCNIGYYDIGVEDCQKCHYSCQTCNSGDSNSCISCIEMNTSKRVFYNNTCVCLFGYYDDGSKISCLKCDIQCLSCVQQSYQCLSCPQTRKIETNCKCQQGYYDVGLQICLQCNSNCFTCEISSKNCTSCDSNQFRELNIKTQTCDCQIGYLEINEICQKCYFSCKTCAQSINNCTSCVQFRYLKNNECICNEGMYESNVDKLCKLCNQTCLTCANSNSYCLTCSIENFRQFTYGNTCECRQGYYEDSVTLNCEYCSSSCLTCSLLYDNCTSCDSSLNLSLVNNKCACSQSYFFDPLTKQCEQCNITCLECQNSNQCTQCRLTTRHYDADEKKCLCNDGYYETNQLNCQLCHLSCGTCQNVSTNCLTCQSVYIRILKYNQCLCLDGYYDAGIELCQKCNNICKTCQSSAVSCLSCYEIEQHRDYSGDKCLCKMGYYESNTEICSKCSNQCLTCQGSAEYCTSCDTNSKRVDQSIIHKCPCILGFYSDENQNCQKCHIKCQTCITSNDQCLSCNFQLNSNRMSISSFCNCQEGYFDDGIQLQCQNCNFRCKTCQIEENNCQIFQNILRFNPPTCNCKDGYYEDEQLICQICASQCNTCILQPTNCLSCNPGRIQKDCKCIDGYFEIGLTLCSQCAFQCATCELYPLNYKTCKGNRIQEPKCICQFGYFDDQLNEDCQKCDITCLECNINGCLSCFANRLLDQEMNCIPPQNSIWYDSTPWCSTCEVAVIKAYFSDDLSQIIIHFDFPLNPKGFSQQIQINKCLQIFEVESAKSFGQNSVCYLNQEDNQELLIQLGENSKIQVGEQILFKSNALSQINCETTLKIFIFDILQMPINPLPPSIQYQVPLHKLNPKSDNSIYIKSIKNNGNRKLDNIIWSYQMMAGEDSSNTISQFLDQINFVQEYNLLIPKLTLPKDAELKFKIQYENFIHINSQTEFTIHTHSGILPQININSKPSYFVYQPITIGVSAGNSDQSISKDNYQIQMNEIDREPNKSIPSQINSSFQSTSFEMIYITIPKYTLSPNSTYTFQVMATNINTNQTQYQNFTFDIPFAGFICQFNNLGLQSIRKDLKLQIECKDLDTIFDWNADPNLSIEYMLKCTKENNQCQQDCDILIHKEEFFSTFTVQQWTVTVTKFQQTQKFTQIIVYLDDDFPQLDLEFNKGYLMRKINNYEQLNFTFLIPFDKKPLLLDLSIAIIYNYEIIEILQPQYISHQFKIFNSIKELNFGDEINLKFLAQYTNNIMPSLNNIKININQPPQCSKLYITRSNNLALTDFGVASSCDQSNDSPYSYQLRLFLRESDLTDFQQGSLDNSLILYPFQTQNQFLIQTPSSIDFSKIGILVEVLDNGGSMTQIFEQITVNFAKINCSSIQYQNLNLQKKISLLFEALNQKCDELHSQIYLNMLQQSILADENENILKFQALKLYKQLLIQSIQNKPQDNLPKQRCFDKNTNHFFITNNTTETEVNLTTKIESLKENTQNLNKTLNYFRNLKKKFEEDIQLNQYTWNEQIFQQYQNTQECLRSLLFYLDDIYSNFSLINVKNEILYQAIMDLQQYMSLISEETQNTIIVNQKPLAINGNEIIWQIKRRTISQFNQQFDIEPAKEDFLVEYVQFESIYFKTNPLRFTSDLQDLLYAQFNDQTLQILSQNYYLTSLKNSYHHRFISYENFSSTYGTKFGSYQVCSNTTQSLFQYEVQCVIRTIFGKIYLCNLQQEQNNDTIELTCDCNKFGEIFLLSSTNFSIANVNNTNIQISDLSVDSTSDNQLVLQICTSSLSFIFMAVYVVQRYKDYKEEQESSENEQRNLNPSNILLNRNFVYKGNSKVFKEKLKQIHQTISLFNQRLKYLTQLSNFRSTLLIQFIFNSYNP